MSGPSFEFVGFAILVALFVASGRSLLWRQSVMLVASIVFLASFSDDPLAFLPFAGFLLAGYIALRLTERKPDPMFPVAIVGTLLLFFWIKRYAFVPSGLWLTRPYVTIGLSYILFRLLHLIIEVRSDPSCASLPFRTYLGYLVGFNTLVAGPIQLFDDYAAQHGVSSTNLSRQDLRDASERIIIGLFKTNVLAAVLAHSRDEYLSMLSSTGGESSRLLAGAATFILYPLFLYCNFSGYIDIVIGVTRLMSYRLPENFDRPFSATSFIDFWNRWHITLSRWFRIYVYNPLLIALLRRFPARRYESLWATAALFVTFFLVGAWHGQTMAFLFYGFLQGLGISVNKIYQLTMARTLGKKRYALLSSGTLYEVFARGLTFTWFTFTLTWFWASWHDAATVWAALSPASWLIVWSAILLFSSGALWAWEIVRRDMLSIQWSGAPLLNARRVRAAWYSALFVVVIAVVLLSKQSAPENVYRNF
jgi:alginate O-acetyltransferase complex protein AlgI